MALIWVPFGVSLLVTFLTILILIPRLERVNLWIFYPLILVPLELTGAANAVSMLAGFNGGIQRPGGGVGDCCDRKPIDHRRLPT